MVNIENRENEEVLFSLEEAPEHVLTIVNFLPLFLFEHCVTVTHEASLMLSGLNLY